MKLMVTAISVAHLREKKIKMPTTKTGHNIKNVLVHAGDFSHSQKTFDDFLLWFSEVPGYDFRCLIAGNQATN